MIYKLLSIYDRKNPIEQASAHCDIPCKIYDPISAQICALTMLRMVDLLEELAVNDSLTAEQQATFTRYVNEKEVQGRKIKEEITIIWGDYIKQPQLDQFPELHLLTHQIMLAASFAKQHINREATLSLLDKINHFAEIFWTTKNVPVYRAKSPYPPAETLVYPDLKA